MPRRYTTKRKVARKGKAKLRYRTKRKANRNRSTANKIVAKFGSGIVFPRQYVCKLKYSDIIPITGGLNSLDRVFCMNDIYDTDITGTGHQPRYHDQLANLYNSYRVVASKIKVRYMPTDATTPNQTHYLMVIPTVSSTSMSGSTYLALNEMPYARSVINNIYGRRSQITKYLPISAIAGVHPTVVKSADDYGALYGTSPSKRFYWHVMTGTMNEGATTINGQLAVDITFYVISERPNIPGSS